MRLPGQRIQPLRLDDDPLTRALQLARIEYLSLPKKERSYDELDLNCRLTENSVCCRKRCRSQLSLFWHFVEEIMQNIIRDRWGVAHIDKSEARMPRLLQGYVICDACSTSTSNKSIEAACMHNASTSRHMHMYMHMLPPT